MFSFSTIIRFIAFDLVFGAVCGHNDIRCDVWVVMVYVLVSRLAYVKDITRLLIECF